MCMSLYKTKQMYLINKTLLFAVPNTSFLHQKMKIFTIMQGQWLFRSMYSNFIWIWRSRKQDSDRIQYIQTLDRLGGNHLIWLWVLENMKYSHVVACTVGGHQHAHLIFLTSFTAVAPANLTVVFSILPHSNWETLVVMKAACLRNDFFFFLSQDQPEVASGTPDPSMVLTSSSCLQQLTANSTTGWSLGWQEANRAKRRQQRVLVRVYVNTFSHILRECSRRACI